ncbi:hypothetical protein LCGC14_0996870 [marine sediment metagenome]|uniref:Uncharacterized protein n=1 Tax=marine sediment metagenome TaxID=412755 RepID=A0A0F9RAE0_9ZZZZ
MTTAVTPILDARLIEALSELRGRLTRGGLSPEAVQKAIEAYKAGDLHALNFATSNGALVVPIPEELLVRVFPQLLDQALDGDRPWKAFLDKCPLLEYEINRHRGDRKSLTIRWPGAKAEEGPDPEPAEASGKEAVTASAADGESGNDPF